jgi:hypothetical protein
VGAPSIAADRDGGLHVTFERGSSDCDGPLSIMYTTKRGPGAHWSRARAIARHRPHSQFATPSTLVVDHRGRWHLVYGHWLRSGPRDRTMIRYRNSSARRAATIARASNDAPGPDCHRVGAPSIAAAPNGALHVTFERGSTNCDAPLSIMHATKNDAGAHWSRPRARARHSMGLVMATPSSLAIDSRGRWHLVYGDRAQLGTQANTWVRYLNSASRGPMTIAAATADTDTVDCSQVGAPSIAASRGGLLHVSFQQLSRDCSAQQSIMYARSR